MPPADHCPGRLEELTFDEQLVLWAVRHRFAGRNRIFVERELSPAGGGANTRAALDFVLHVLGVAGRRTLRLHRLCRDEVTRDEMALLALVAAVQNAEATRAECLLLWLLPPAAARIASPVVAQLAAGLAAAGRVLPCRSTPRPLRTPPTEFPRCISSARREA